MGQYYKPIILKSDRKHIVGYVYSHDYGCGLKLMEHSYIHNPMCVIVENYLKEHNGANVVWAGDYADAEPVKLPKEQAKTIWQNMVSDGQTETSFADFWAKDKRACVLDANGDFEGECLYSLAGEKYNDNDKVIRRAKPKLTASATENNNIRFLVNETKKQFVDLWEVPSVDGYRIHPLPLLTCEGNGRGGGDYDGLDMELVGSWARDFITVQEHDWTYMDYLKNSGYTKIEPVFVEIYSIKSELSNLAKYVEKAMTQFDTASDPRFTGEVREAAKQILAALPKVSPEEARVMKK